MSERDVNSNSFTLIFLSAIVFVSALLLSLAATALKPMQTENKIFDKKKTVMTALGIEIAADDTRQSISDRYANRVEKIFVNPKGEVVEVSEADAAKYSFLKALKSAGVHLKAPKDYSALPADLALPVYIGKDADGNVTQYAFECTGYGLWSQMFGIISLDAKDLNTVKNVVFYDNKETPGLGKEIEETWFEASFVGKQFLNAKGEVKSIIVKKGGYDQGAPTAVHYVDSVSGATITSDGVTDLLKKDFLLYNNFFATKRKGT